MVTGVVPSWPLALYPQQCTAPSEVTAHVWKSPQARERTFETPGTGSDGEDTDGRLISSPSAPLLLSPQHLTDPDAVAAQTCATPVQREIASPIPATLLVIYGKGPIPETAPDWSPQHAMPLGPAVRKTQLNSNPEDNEKAVMPGTISGLGELVVCVGSCPNSPCELAPQQ